MTTFQPTGVCVCSKRVAKPVHKIVLMHMDLESAWVLMILNEQMHATAYFFNYKILHDVQH